MIKHLYGTAKSTVTDIDQKCIQPNAVELRVVSIEQIQSHTEFEISDIETNHRKKVSLRVDEQNRFHLRAGEAYEFITNHDVVIAEGECGLIIPRSSLNRNGIFITSSLYDSGFSGRLGGVIHCRGDAILHKNVRIGQFLIFSAETYSLYDGSYGHGKVYDETVYGKKGAETTCN